ncbi:MAG: hypothetical protein QM451_09335 [Bacillota bacterium]|jgi:hypothetical protein|nr:hypothetical protein [Bacillota bacterium]HHT89430.1 YjbH domain-containing protein [Bacillota bacterium]
MRKIRGITLIMFILLAAVSMEALAFGVLEMPTADVSNEALELDFLHHRGVSSLRAQFGFYPGLSAGVRQDFGGQLYLIAKAAILEETQEWPGLALGADLSLGKRQHLYAVLSKQLGNPSLRAHAAIGLGRYSSGMAGVSYVLNPVKVKNLPTTSLFVEYDGRGFNGGLIAQFAPEFKAKIGLASEHGLSFGVSYRASF